MKAVIFDMDGTLADVTHRRVHLDGGKKDWAAWNAGMANDAPNQDVIDLFMSVRYDYPVFIFSGRIERENGIDYRYITEKWLHENGIQSGDYKELWMRAEGDYRSDVVVKRQMLNELRSQGYEVAFVVDDRQSVVDMWREEGITCLQCAPGDFDLNNKSKYDPGKLTLLVGPSGAGKSTYLESMQPEFDKYPLQHLQSIVSSDLIRQHICGDFKDQSKNDQVFAALHALVKARVEHGLDVVVDATNIRAKDRRALRELAPDNATIHYILINRSMEDKIRDGGWRNDVMIKGQSLIERHEEVFRMNLKDILKGDDDPRVFVTDLRKWKGE